MPDGEVKTKLVAATIFFDYIEPNLHSFDNLRIVRVFNENGGFTKTIIIWITSMMIIV